MDVGEVKVSDDDRPDDDEAAWVDVGGEIAVQENGTHGGGGNGDVGVVFGRPVGDLLAESQREAVHHRVPQPYFVRIRRHAGL